MSSAAEYQSGSVIPVVHTVACTYQYRGCMEQARLGAGPSEPSRGMQKYADQSIYVRRSEGAPTVRKCTCGREVLKRREDRPASIWSALIHLVEREGGTQFQKDYTSFRFRALELMDEVVDERVGCSYVGFLRHIVSGVSQLTWSYGTLQSRPTTYSDLSHRPMREH